MNPTMELVLFFLVTGVIFILLRNNRLSKSAHTTTFDKKTTTSVSTRDAAYKYISKPKAKTEGSAVSTRDAAYKYISEPKAKTEESTINSKQREVFVDEKANRYNTALRDELARKEAAQKEEYLKQQALYLEAREKELREKEESLKRLKNDELARKEAAQKEEYLKQQALYLEAREKELREKEESLKRLKNDELARKEAVQKEEYLKQQALYLEAREKELREKELQKCLENEESIRKAEYEKVKKLGNRNSDIDGDSLRANSQKNKRKSQSTPSLNTGITELDGPGMYQRLNAYGPQGHICYLMYSKAHNAYKVGHCPHDYLGERFKQIRKTVPDLAVYGTAVFTSRQNAFDAEQKVLNDNRQYQYRGIHGDHSGGSEWLTRRPSSKKPSFMSPKKVEERYQKQVNAPLQLIEIPDKYTVYLAYSKSKNAYKVKWCNSENLPKKIANLQSEAADTIIVSRFKVETKGKAREITKTLNAAAGAFQTSGRDDLVKWVNNPSYLKEFKPWDKNGKRIIT